MTRGNIIPAALLVVFLATGIDLPGVQSHGSTTPRADLRVVLVSLSDAFESSLHLRGFAEDAQSSLLRLNERVETEIESIKVRLESRLNSSWPSEDYPIDATHTSKTM